jgi:YARHG domain
MRGQATLSARSGLRTTSTRNPDPLPAIDESKLSPIDHQNAEAIAKYDASLSRVQLRSMLQDGMGSIRASGAAPEDKIELRLLSARLGKWFGPSDTPSEERSPLEDPSVLDMQLSMDQLKDLSRRDLRLLRNTVYARRGRPFRSDLLRAYFEATEWYKADTSYTEARLTSGQPQYQGDSQRRGSTRRPSHRPSAPNGGRWDSAFLISPHVPSLALTFVREITSEKQDFPTPRQPPYRPGARLAQSHVCHPLPRFLLLPPMRS